MKELSNIATTQLPSEAYWDRRPCNVRHGTDPVGSEEWSRQVTARKYFVEPHIPAFAQFNQWCGKRVLEVGCGIGTDTLSFAQAGANIVAIDLSRESLKLASQRMPRRQYPNVELVHTNAEIALPDGPFDLIYSFGVLHHICRPLRALQLMKMRLRHDGELYLMVYAKRSLKSLLDEQPEAQPGCQIMRRYSKGGIKDLLWRAGFTASDVRRIHIFPYRVDDYVKHQYVRRWYLPAWLMPWLEPALGDHLLVKARLR